MEKENKTMTFKDAFPQEQWPILEDLAQEEHWEDVLEFQRRRHYRPSLKELLDLAVENLKKKEQFI
jgi:hypothetical protein